MRFQSFRLFMLLTGVLLVLGSGSLSFAENDGGAAAKNAEMDRREKLCNAMSDPIKKQRCLDAIAFGTSSGTKSDPCIDLQEQLNKEDQNFKKACSSVGLSGNACDTSYAQCNECSFAGEDENTSSLCDGVNAKVSKTKEGSLSGSQNDMMQTLLGSLANKKNYSSGKNEEIPYMQFAACPQIALEAAAEAKELLETQREEEQKLKEKIAEKKLAVQEAQAAIDTANETYKQASDEVNTKYESDRDELTEQGTAESKALSEDVTKKSIAVRTARENKVNLQLVYNEKLAQIRAVCEAQAEAELKAKRDGQAGALSKSQLESNNLKTLIADKKSGRLAVDEAFRDRATKRCQANNVRWADRIKELNDWARAQERLLANAVTDAENDLVKAQTELAQANPKQQEKLQKLAKKATEDQKKLFDANQKKIGSCPQVQNAQQAAKMECTGLAQGVNLARNSLTEAESDLTSKQADMQYTQKLLSAAKSATGGKTKASSDDISASGSSVVSILDRMRANSCDGFTKTNMTLNERLKRMQGNAKDEGSSTLNPSLPNVAEDAAKAKAAATPPAARPGPQPRSTQQQAPAGKKKSTK